MVTVRLKLEQNQDVLKSSLAKVETQGTIIAGLNDKCNRLSSEKAELEELVRSLEDDLKVMKTTAHLKTKHDLFKEFEQHGGSEWDLQAAYDA